MRAVRLVAAPDSEVAASGDAARSGVARSAMGPALVGTFAAEAAGAPALHVAHQGGRYSLPLIPQAPPVPKEHLTWMTPSMRGAAVAPDFVYTSKLISHRPGFSPVFTHFASTPLPQYDDDRRFLRGLRWRCSAILVRRALILSPEPAYARLHFANGALWIIADSPRQGRAVAEPRRCSTRRSPAQTPFAIDAVRNAAFT